MDVIGIYKTIADTELNSPSHVEPIEFNCTDGKLLATNLCLPKGYNKADIPSYPMYVSIFLNILDIACWMNILEADDKNDIEIRLRN